VTPDGFQQEVSGSSKHHRWRSRKDSLARWTIASGGILVIAAIGMIFFYLLWVVFPLFTPASSEKISTPDRVSWVASQPVWLSLEEQKEVGFRISREGTARFFEITSGDLIESFRLDVGDQDLVLAVGSSAGPDQVALVNSQGQVYVLAHRYSMDYSQGVDQRVVVPTIEYPYGPGPLISAGGAVVDIAMVDDERELTIAAITKDGLLSVYRAEKRVNMLTGELALETASQSRQLEISPTTVAVSGNRSWIYLGDRPGNVHRLDLDTLEHRQALKLSGDEITELTMLLGGISVLAGDSEGRIRQAFPVRSENQGTNLQLVREFPPQPGAIREIVAEPRRKGFIALDALGRLGFYHSTAERRVLEVALGEKAERVGLAPRANGILVEGPTGHFELQDIVNPHPDVSWSNLWEKVWYENYPEPDYVWQSSAANTDFEPKFSLTPLVFGTLKAALYAMLFAMPLALMAAAYTAYFLAPAIREVVKPAVEIMAALPTVVLGFLAGLWFAPFLEKHLAGIFMVLLLVPVGVLVFAWGWHRYNGHFKQMISEGTEPLLLIPVIVILSMLAIWLADPVQGLVFGGDLRTWLTQQAGIDYDQRNALVVGCAMGFAVIPTIFSIAEDALYGVPKSLSMGSLALGATPWQTVLGVVLPTASPGIFSALMIGFGRAMGETMIVLMASGNTPIMDWNVFEGMRTLAANIAVEMPESAVNSSHFRVLFLAALVLFVFTFIVNTGAEVVRQHLRQKYSSL